LRVVLNVSDAIRLVLLLHRCQILPGMLRQLIYRLVADRIAALCASDGEERSKLVYAACCTIRMRNLLPIIVPCSQASWSQQPFGALPALDATQIRSALGNVIATFAFAIKLLRLLQVMSSIRRFPQHVRVRDCEMLAGFDDVGRPEHDFASIAEALRNVGPTRMLKERGAVINGDTRWIRKRQFVAIYLGDSINLADLLLRPFVALEEATKERKRNVLRVTRAATSTKSNLPRYELRHTIQIGFGLICNIADVVARLKLQQLVPFGGVSLLQQ